jgi:hypothetical protein
MFERVVEMFLVQKYVGNFLYVSKSIFIRRAQVWQNKGYI